MPATQFPEAGVSEPFARELMRRVPAADLARTLERDPNLLPLILRHLGTATMTTDRMLRERLGSYLREVVRVSASAADAQRLTTLIVIDPLRYGKDAAFRQRINQGLPQSVAMLPPPKARAVLEELTRSAAIEFDVAERAAAAAHLAPRSSAERRIPFDAASVRMPDDISGPIEASIYSLNSSFFTAGEMQRFIGAVHAASPQRRIVVLGDAPFSVGPRSSAATPPGTAAPHDRIDTFGRAFTPWPRDPFIAARTARGGIVFINRPNAQPGREEDQHMARAIVDGGPWPATWTVAPIPFHNGHILLTPTTVWISMHTVEPRAMEIFGTGDPRADPPRYVAAIRRAAEELQQFYRRPVRFVHPLSPDLLNTLIGGAGFDLDSIVTILPGTALVGDINLGTVAGRRSPVAEWSAVQREYPLRGTRDDYISAQNAPRTVALQAFLDLVAAELKRDGLTVRRLPLLNIPTSFVARDDVPQDKDFLITWNNVVLENDRAEGFAALLTSIDDEARKTFAESGFKLTLFPPLTHSIVLGGGYRCVSNHLRPSPRGRGERVAEGRVRRN